MKSIFQQIKEVRLSQGLTQKQLAIRSGLKYQEAIARFEKGEKGVTMDTLYRIARALGKEIVFTDLAEPNLRTPHESGRTRKRRSH